MLRCNKKAKKKETCRCKPLIPLVTRTRIELVLQP